jgi:DNA recombination protein RmuC
MDNILYLVIGVILGVAAGFFIGASRSKASAGKTFEVEYAAANAKAEALQTQINQLEAARIQREAKDSQENSILQALEPLKVNLQAMQAKVTELETSRHQQFGTVESQLRQSIEESQKLSKQTETLAKAMSDSQMRGSWGEVQLRRLIEEAGLINLADFVEQKGDGDGQRPDVTLKLPGGKHILIDSKVPFDAYMEASAISDLGSPEELDKRQSLLEKHALHVRSHVKKLGDKKYWNGITESPPFVIAYIPSESLLAAALHADPGLLEFAFKNGVALASPVSLFSVLKTVTYIWRQEANEASLANVIKLGKLLYQRISKIAEHAQALGTSLKKTSETYNAFAVSLESNLLTTAKDANKFDETQFGTANIPEIEILDFDVHEFRKPELIQAEIEAVADEEKP